MSTAEHSKVLIQYSDGNGNLEGIESLWAVEVDENRYRLDNVPFYATEYALGDIVEAEERDGANYVVGLVQASGHSTVQILFNQVEDVEPTTLALHAMGCATEGSHLPTLISVDVPPDVSYFLVVKPFY
jgi:hypothetical protein